MTQSSPAALAAERARRLLEVRRYEDAGKAAMEGLQNEPNNAMLLGLLAMALDGEGRFHDARMWSERSLGVDPQQAWVHNLRATAILDGAGSPQEAIQSAHAAVQLDQFDTSYRYTLTRAYLLAGNRSDAQTIARSIRGVDPNSTLGPLAEALVEIDRARFLKIHPVWAVIAVVLTRGFALVIWAVIWLVVFARRVGPLRRADRLLLEALRLDPGNPHTHDVAAIVAEARFRYVRSVDASLATAAIDAGLVNADELAGQIVRRTCVAALVACVFWCAWLPALSGVPSQSVAAAVAIAVGLVAGGGVAWLDREQTKRLPAGLSRRVRGKWALPTTATVIAAFVLWIGVAVASGSSMGVAVAAFVCGAAVAGCAAILIARFVSARR